MFRPADSDDLVTLLDLERAASTAGLAHVFGPDLPFPDGDVLARWRLVLDEPGLSVLIDEADGDPIGYAAFGNGWLRHFGYRPDWWGTGRADALHRHVLAALAEQGEPPFRLWVLVDNHRARAFYTRRGWVEAGVRDYEVFAPYPEKTQLSWSGPAP